MMRDTFLRARLLCWLGLHAWHGQTCSGEDWEARGCRNCPEMQARPISISGHPIAGWEEIEPEPMEQVW